MRTPNTFQIGSTTYTTREYCHARGITDNAAILKIQWRINTYIRNHTIQQTIEELDRLTLTRQNELRHRIVHKTQTENQPTTGIKMNLNDKISGDGTRPWQGAKQERIIAQREIEATRAIDQRELLRRSEWMNNSPYALKTPPSRENLESMLGTEDPRLQNIEEISRPQTRISQFRKGAIEIAIAQYAEAILTEKRLLNELKDAQKEVEKWSINAAALLRDV